MSKRSEILKYIQDKLECAALFDGPVFASQDKAYTLEELPCVLLLISKEKQEVFTESAPRVIKKTAEVSLHMIAEHVPGIEEELHEAFSDIEYLILSDDTLGDLVSRLMPDSLEFTSFMQGERPITSGRLKFDVIYYESMAIKEDLPDLQLMPEIILKEELNNGTGNK